MSSDDLKPLYEFHRPTKPGAPEIAFLSLIIFRACFDDDEDEAIVPKKWNEWQDQRYRCIRLAKRVLKALGGDGSILAALGTTQPDTSKGLAEDLKAWCGYGQGLCLPDEPCTVCQAADAIATLTARAERAEAERDALKAELAQRPQWAGGQSPITCGPSGSLRAPIIPNNGALPND